MMRWYRIPIPRIVQPQAGTYSNWKPLLRTEGNHRCAYCAIHEAAWGGTRNFHVEHYRPKSKYPDLINLITNLFYACSVCNSFKREDWPGDPRADLGNICYPDPSEIDFNDLFTLQDGFRIEGANLAARYVIQRLYLNRPQLILERRASMLRDRLAEITAGMERAVHDILAAGHAIPGELIKDMAAALAAVGQYTRTQQYVPPYEPIDVQRPS